jgi:putative transposase
VVGGRAPDRFGCIEDPRAFCIDFFRCYNTEHYHGGIGLMTPHDVRCGLAVVRRDHRGPVLAAAHQAHPERFLRGLPTPAAPPTAVWINKPSTEETTQ